MFVVYMTYKKDHPAHNYIGKSDSHNTQSRNYMGSGIYIARALSKYGKKSFTREILAEYDNEQDAYDGEMNFIKEYQPYYNISVGGSGVGSGENHPNYGKPGKKHTDESKQNLHDKFSEDKHPRYKPDIDIKVILDLVKQGMSYRKIAKHLGTTHATINRRIKWNTYL